MIISQEVITVKISKEVITVQVLSHTVATPVMNKECEKSSRIKLFLTGKFYDQESRWTPRMKIQQIESEVKPHREEDSVYFTATQYRWSISNSHPNPMELEAAAKKTAADVYAFVACTRSVGDRNESDFNTRCIRRQSRH